MRTALALSLALLPGFALAQAPGAPPLMPASPYSAPSPYMPPSPQMAPQPGAPLSGAGGPGAAQQGYGGCYGCSYSGDYFGSGYGYAPPVRRPAPPPRIQGQWRNGLWYY